MADLPDGSLGVVCCDPPYGLEFMGRDWDKCVPDQPGDGRFSDVNNPYGRSKVRYGGSQSYGSSEGVHLRQQAWHQEWLVEALRVLEPGGLIKAFGGSRTFHRMAAAMVEVGFIDIRMEAWGYGSGFPKSLNVGKAIDKQGGARLSRHKEVQAYLRSSREAKGMSRAEVDREVFGGTTRYGWVEGRGGARSYEVYLPTPEEWMVLKEVLGLDDRFDNYIRETIPSREHRHLADGGKGELVGVRQGSFGYHEGERWKGQQRVVEAKTEQARAWEGWGTALKPSWEPVLVGRKP
jgi:hypothetical protein